MCRVSGLVAAAGGPVAGFSGFADFEEGGSGLLVSFPGAVGRMGSFGRVGRDSLFRFCRPILDIFGFTLLTTRVILKKI